MFERAAQRQRRSVIHNEPIEAAPVEPVYRDFDDKPMYPPEKIGREIMRLLSEGKSIATSDDPLSRIGAEVRQSGRAFQNIIGLGDGERQQTWPERMIRSAATLPGDVVTGAEPIGQTGDRFSPHIIERAQELAGLSGGAPLMAKPGSATLGAGVTRRGIKEVPHPENIVSHDMIARHERKTRLPVSEFARSKVEAEFERQLAHGDGIPLLQDVKVDPKDLRATQGWVEKGYNINLEPNEGPYPILGDQPIGIQTPDGKVHLIDGHHRADWSLRHKEPFYADVFKADGSTLLSDTTKPALAIEALKGGRAEPFYSAVEAAVRDAPDQVMTPEQWGGYLRNRPGVKAEELDWIGLPEGSKISKQEMLDHAKEHGVQMKEVRKEGDQLPHEDDLHEITERRALENTWNNNPELRKKYNDDVNEWVETPEYDRAYKQAEEEIHSEFGAGSQPTKFSEYQLPGGDNYREVLFTLPTKEKGNPVAHLSIDESGRDFRVIDNRQNAEVDRFGSRAEAQQAIDQIARDAQDAYHKPDNQYHSSHWDEPNVLAHARMNDRTIPDVGKTLHLEELQSDWHQQGRKQGYKDASKEPDFRKAQQEYSDMTPQLHSIVERNNNFGYRDMSQAMAKMREQGPDVAWPNASVEDKALAWKALDKFNEANELGKATLKGVPDAPFKTSWPDLVLKRMIREAAENGYDAVSWTPGEAQAARYDLSKQVSKLEFLHNRDKVGDLMAWDHRGQQVINKRVNDPKELADLIGKEAAERLMSEKHDMGNGLRRLEGVDLKVGGEGMKGFYDDMLVRKANALGKKYGAKVEWKELPHDYQIYEPTSKHPEYRVDSIDHPLPDKEFKTRAEAEAWIKERSPKVPVFRLTSELKDVAMRKGFPLFSAGVPFPLIPVDHDPFKETK